MKKTIPKKQILQLIKELPTVYNTDMEVKQIRIFAKRFYNWLKNLLKNLGVKNVKTTITKIVKNEIQNPGTRIANVGVTINLPSTWFTSTEEWSLEKNW